MPMKILPSKVACFSKNAEFFSTGLVAKLAQKAELCITKSLLKFIHSEKATKFSEISSLLLNVCTVVKSKVKILQNFVAFSECMNFKRLEV